MCPQLLSQNLQRAQCTGRRKKREREEGRRGGGEEERTDGSLIPLLRYYRTTISSTGLGTRSVPTYLTSDFTNYSRKIKVFPLPVETGKSSGITCVAVTQTGRYKIGRQTYKQKGRLAGGER